LLLIASSTALAQDKPNIVFMMADNLGYGDVGVYGGGELRGAPTPRIDNLAREGLRLTQFLVEPGCTPSRAATMTSRYSVRSGLSLVIVPGTPNTLAADANTLAADEVTMAEVMKSVGYDTGYFGKWHLGTEAKSLPHNQGFDTFYGIPNTTDETLYIPTSTETEAPLPDGFSEPSIIRGRAGGDIERVKPYNFDTRRQIDVELADMSVDFIQQHADDDTPFFLFVAWTRPHYPNFTSPEFEGASRIGVYGDSLMELDHNTGRVLDAIDEAGLKDKTGPMRTNTWPDSGSAGPFRGELGDPLEGSIRTIGMIRWPGKIKPGTSNEMFSTMDFMPTFARIVGAKMPEDRPIDGIDQLEFLLGEQRHSNREYLITFTGEQLQAVRWRQYRYYLIEVVPSGFGASRQEGLAGTYRKLHYPLIYNIEADPREEFNINTTRGWVAGHAMRIIGEYLQTLEEHPNSPAPNLVDF
jgi:arylsulfatase